MDAAVLDALEIECYDLGCFDTHSVLDAAVLYATVLDGTILDVVNTPYEGDFGCFLEVMNVACCGFGCCVNWMLRSWMLQYSPVGPEASPPRHGRRQVAAGSGVGWVGRSLLSHGKRMRIAHLPSYSMPERDHPSCLRGPIPCLRLERAHPSPERTLPRPEGANPRPERVHPRSERAHPKPERARRSHGRVHSRPQMAISGLRRPIPGVRTERALAPSQEAQVTFQTEVSLSDTLAEKGPWSGLGGQMTPQSRPGPFFSQCVGKTDFRLKAHFSFLISGKGSLSPDSWEGPSLGLG